MPIIYIYFVENKEDTLTLSEEDKKLLEKWKTMHGQTQKQTHKDNGEQATLPINTVQGAIAQPIVLQQFLVPTQTISVQNQNQTVFNIVQVPVLTTLLNGAESTNIIQDAKNPTAVNSNGTPTKTKNSTKISSADNVHHDSIHSKMDQTALTRASRSSFHSDHTYHKPPIPEDVSHGEMQILDDQLKADEWLNVLTQKVSRSHIDDLTLDGTPKGSGSGYGLGDLENLLSETAGGANQAEGNDR